MSRTKIVATIGPASSDPEILRELIREGINVARINFSHGSHATHKKNIDNIRRIADEEGRVVGILGDLQGPKIRLGEFETIEVRKGDIFYLTTDPDPNEADHLPLPHPELIDAAQIGARLVLGDGEMELRVISKSNDGLRAEVVLNGLLEQRKGVNTPGTSLPIPTITKKDREDLRFICNEGLDFVALSFVRTASDIIELRALIRLFESDEIAIIAKIEKFEAIEHLAEIADAADGMMVARGDLGIDLPAEQIPLLQKRIIIAGNKRGKPVITATQMLQSMVNAPRPTRAEASDVANAILDGTDAVMLSGETASGNYPVEAVRMMGLISEMMEEAFPYEEWKRRRNNIAQHGRVAEAISTASCSIAERIEAKAILTTSMTGYTAQQISRHRPVNKIIAVTPLVRTQRRLALVWGVECDLMPAVKSTDDLMAKAIDSIKSVQLRAGDTLVITGGVPFGKSGVTNLIQVHTLH